MKTVTIIGFNGALASAITGMIDLFRLAGGVTWARIHGEQPTAWFRTRLLTEDGEPCRCINGVTLLADGSWQDIDELGADDLLIIPTIGAPIDEVLQTNPPLLIQWLSKFQTATPGDVRVASNCTGAFLLAAAGGLLDGREATTHWGGFGEQFRRQFPAVNLHADKLVTVDGPVACAGGGGMAWWDLGGVYLVERLAGAQVARELAKAFVIDAGRTSQAPIACCRPSDTIQTRWFTRFRIGWRCISESRFHCQSFPASPDCPRGRCYVGSGRRQGGIHRPAICSYSVWRRLAGYSNPQREGLSRSPGLSDTRM